MTAIRPDCRRFLCDLCEEPCMICSQCDRGHRYCSSSCRDKARRRNVREAGRRYQNTARGRRHHARRQAEYLRRKQRKMTHHSCRPRPRSASVKSCSMTRQGPPPRRIAAAWSSTKSSKRPTYFVCCVCGMLCEPRVRLDFLRCRRH